MARVAKRKKTYNEKNERYTPPVIFDALDYIFDLDPASPGEGKSFVTAKKHYAYADDGLTQEWEGTVFLSPPTTNIGSWLQKLAEHGDGIALVTLRPDAAWFQEASKEASTLCLVEEKIVFYKGGKTKQYSTGTAVALLSFGDRAKEILLTSELGVCLSTDSAPAWRWFDDEDEDEGQDEEISEAENEETSEPTDVDAEAEPQS